MLRRGMSVRAAVRRGRESVLPEGCACARIDELSPETDWTEALRGVKAVIHLAARVHVMRDDAVDPLAVFRQMNVAATLHLARQAAACGVHRLVFVSSIKVNGEMTADGDRYSEADTPSPQDAYGCSKWEAEQALWRLAGETGLQIVVVRPPLVYGPAAKGNFASLLRVLRLRLPLPLASVRNRRSMIYVGNLADALIRCATHPAAAMHTYLVSDGEDLATPDLLRRLGAAMGRPVSLWPCPPGWLRLAGKLLGKRAQVERLIGSLRVDDRKIRGELGWAPPYSLEQGFRATVV